MKMCGIQESYLVRRPVKVFFLKNGCRKDGKRSFVPVDVQIEESNVTLLFLFLSERDGG